MFRPADPPRESTVEFTGGRRPLVLPMRGALPHLTRAGRLDEVHPSVGLLSAATLLGMRLVAAGRIEPAGEEPASWRIGPLDAADDERVVMLAQARAYDDLPPAAAESLVRAVLDAVADAVPRRPPDPSRRTTAPRATAPLATATAGRRAPPVDFSARLQGILERSRTGSAGDRPHLVTLGLRVEAEEDELIGGRVRLVLFVRDEQDPTHVADAALLWGESGADASHGFGERARTHATIALRAAADDWPVLERLLELRVPDEITLDAVEVAGLLDDGIDALRARGIDVLWPRALSRDLTTSTVLRPRGGESLTDGLFGPDALFSFDWQLALHGDPLTDAEMDQLAAATSPIIRLRDNWTVVDTRTAQRARRRLVRTARPAQALAATLTGIVSVDDQDVVVHVGATLERVRERIRSAPTREPVESPAGLAATLRDYQRHGLTWLVEMTSLGLGACLADDMGLGKTVTLIGLHLHRLERGADDRAGGPTLVVCPASLLGNWEDEVARFAPGVPVRRFHGGQRDLSGLEAGGPHGAGFVLTTYGTMRRDHAALAEVGWDLVVADEAQHVKNAQSSTAKALRTIGSSARVALTGTPVENDLTELWAILDWATPGLLGSRNAFRKVWAAPIESGDEPSKAAAFADLVGPFLLRRRKSDPGVAPELPDKTETDHRLSLTREQVVLYETLVRESMERIERADEHTRRGLVLALLTGLKQICNHPAHYLRQANPRLGGRSEKVDLLDELVGTVVAEGGAALVFTQYVAMARLLEAHLARQGVPTLFLHGGTPVRDREDMVRRFQAGPEHGGAPVFLLSLKAGGTGLNLTRADHVVHVDRWWNPAVEDQATDRAHRIGQTRTVQVHRLITDGTIEQRIDDLLTRKRALAASVLSSGESALTELSDRELRDLVTLRGHEA